MTISFYSYAGKDMAKDFNISSLKEIQEACSKRAQWLRDRQDDEDIPMKRKLSLDAAVYERLSRDLSTVIEGAES